jgi:hypothetical protein
VQPPWTASNSEEKQSKEQTKDNDGTISQLKKTNVSEVRDGKRARDEHERDQAIMQDKHGRKQEKKEKEKERKEKKKKKEKKTGCTTFSNNKKV